MLPVFSSLSGASSVESARKVTHVVVVGYNQVHHTIKARESFHEKTFFNFDFVESLNLAPSPAQPLSFP